MQDRVLSWLESVVESGAGVDVGRVAPTADALSLAGDALDHWRVGSLFLALEEAQDGRSDRAMIAARSATSSGNGPGSTGLDTSREIARLNQVVANRDKQFADAKKQIEQLQRQLQNRDGIVESPPVSLRDGGVSSGAIAPARPSIAVPASTPGALAPAPSAIPAAGPTVPSVARSAPVAKPSIPIRFDGSKAIHARLDGAAALERFSITVDCRVDGDFASGGNRTFAITDTTPPMLFALGPLAAYLKSPTVLRLKAGSAHRDIELVDNACQLTAIVDTSQSSAALDIKDARGFSAAFTVGTLKIERDLVLGGGYLRRRWLGTIRGFHVRELTAPEREQALRGAPNVGRLVFGFDGAAIVAGKSV